MEIKKIKFKKKAEISSSTLVRTIIVILVVVAVAMFFFKADINNWIRNLPSYTYNEEDELIENLDEDTQVDNVVCNQIGKVDGKTKKIFIDDDETKLLLVNKHKIIGLKFGLGNFKVNYAPVGDILGGNKIKIKIEYIEHPDFLLIYPDLPSMDKLRRLDNSYLSDVNNYLCKTDERIKQDELERKERINKMIDSGKSNEYTFVFKAHKILWVIGSDSDAIDVFWSFEENVPVVKLTFEKDTKKELSTHFLSSVKDFEETLKRFEASTGRRDLGDTDKSYLKFLLSSKNPEEFSDRLEHIFIERAGFYLEYKGEKYDKLSLVQLNNLFYRVDDAMVLIEENFENE